MDYIYTLHFFEAYITGKYFQTPVCVSETGMCVDQMSIFGVLDCNTEFKTQADGYLGLGINDAIGKLEGNNVLNQLHANGQIAEK